jgi:glutamine amidotransferase
MIYIIDCGLGNIHAFINMFARMGLNAKRAKKVKDLSDAKFLILPGVGHFDEAIDRLNLSGMRPKLEELVLGAKIPILGICVGMQILADGSDEGCLPGLGWVPGRVRAFESQLQCKSLPMPHMGWNDLKPSMQKNIYFSNEFYADAQFYFLHSYYFDAEDKKNVVATSSYGLDFDAVVSHGNIYGAQFHLEKSHHWGEKFLKNFLENC